MEPSLPPLALSMADLLHPRLQQWVDDQTVPALVPSGWGTGAINPGDGQVVAPVFTPSTLGGNRFWHHELNAFRASQEFMELAEDHAPKDPHPQKDPMEDRGRFGRQQFLSQASIHVYNHPVLNSRLGEWAFTDGESLFVCQAALESVLLESADLEDFEIKLMQLLWDALWQGDVWVPDAPRARPEEVRALLEEAGLASMGPIVAGPSTGPVSPEEVRTAFLDADVPLPEDVLRPAFERALMSVADEKDLVAVVHTLLDDCGAHLSSAPGRMTALMLVSKANLLFGFDEKWMAEVIEEGHPSFFVANPEKNETFVPYPFGVTTHHARTLLNGLVSVMAGGMGLSYYGFMTKACISLVMMQFHPMFEPVNGVPAALYGWLCQGQDRWLEQKRPAGNLRQAHLVGDAFWLATARRSFSGQDSRGVDLGFVSAMLTQLGSNLRDLSEEESKPPFRKVPVGLRCLRMMGGEFATNQPAGAREKMDFFQRHGLDFQSPESLVLLANAALSKVETPLQNEDCLEFLAHVLANLKKADPALPARFFSTMVNECNHGYLSRQGALPFGERLAWCLENGWVTEDGFAPGEFDLVLNALAIHPNESVHTLGTRLMQSRLHEKVPAPGSSSGALPSRFRL